MMLLSGDDIRRGIIKRAGLKDDAAVGTFSPSLRVESVNRSNRIVWVTATTTDIDSDQEVVVASGADPKSRFFSLKNVFVDHHYDTGSFIGKMRKTLPVYGMGGEQNGWKVQFEVYPLTKSEYADDILTIAERNGLTVSIGMQGYDFGKTTNAEKMKYRQGSVVPISIVRTYNWLELSTTMMPANLSCRQIGHGDDLVIGEEAMKRIDLFDNLLCKGEIKRATADALGFSALTQKRATARLATQLHVPKFRGMILVDGQ